MLYTKTFKSNVEGMHLLALGAVHGDESSGTLAISRLITELEAGVYSLKSGTVTLVPICNAAAYKAHKRYVDVNLNRIIAHDVPQDTNEGKIVPHLLSMINTADVLLDLHNSHKPDDVPFLFIDRDTPELRAYARSLPDMAWVSGWAELYAGRSDLNAGDTVSYALSQNKPALLVECGHSDDAMGAHRAYAALRAALNYFEILDRDKPETHMHKTPHYMFKDVVVRPAIEAKLIQNWQHFQIVSAETVLAVHEDGTPVYITDNECVILLPNPAAKVGDEWFYVGKILGK